MSDEYSMFDYGIDLYAPQSNTDENGRRVYNGSLRSKNRTINDIANKYQGGGHRFACGVKGLYEETIQSLLQDLCERVKDEK